MTKHTRNSEDGFKRDYPASREKWVEDLYREYGWTPPWLLEYKDGKVVGPANPTGRPAPRHEA